jgi:hypothetical protein
VLSEPTLTMSPWFEARRKDYYDCLLGVSGGSRWDECVSFFATGLQTSATSTWDQMLWLALAARDGGKWEMLRPTRLSLCRGEAEAAHLELSYVARRAGALDNGAAKIPFALLISVTDPAGGGDLYDRTRAQSAALRPVARNRNQVRVRAKVLSGADLTNGDQDGLFPRAMARSAHLTLACPYREDSLSRRLKNEEPPVPSARGSSGLT